MADLIAGHASKNGSKGSAFDGRTVSGRAVKATPVILSKCCCGEVNPVKEIN